MATTVKTTCRCGAVFFPRKADLDRGWGKSCSKRCAAVKRSRQERSGNHRPAAASLRYASPVEDNDQSWDAHKHV